MSLLDEWKAPEISPYFDTRFRARLAEAKAAPQGRFAWLRKPVFGTPLWRPAVGALALAMAVAVGVYNNLPEQVTPPPVTAASSAVDDLQKLDQNQQTYSDLDLLDDFDQQPAAQPANGADL